MSFDGWEFRRSHTITHTTGGISDYQIKVRVHYDSGTSSGDDVYLNGKCKSDFGDIRFADSSLNELYYYLDYKEDGEFADFWVKVGSISTETTIYIYYGNAAASTTSDGTNTFILFDDFSTNTIATYQWWQRYPYSTCWNQGISLGGFGYPNTYGISDGKYKVIRSTAGGSSSSGYGALINLTDALSETIICSVSLSFDSRSGGSPSNLYIAFGNFNNACYNFGYWGGVLNGFDPDSSSDQLRLEWNEGKTTDNVKIYRDGEVVHTASKNFGTEHQPLFGIQTDNAGTFNAYFDDFYARKYVSTEPVQTDWGEETSLLIYAKFESIYDLFVSLAFESSYNLQTSTAFESIYGLDFGVIEFESGYSILVSTNFQSAISGGSSTYKLFISRVESATGINAKFVEIL